MKRYLLFAGTQYYPCGGWRDLIESSDDLQELKVRVDGWDWWHIVDTTTGRVIDE